MMTTLDHRLTATSPVPRVSSPGRRARGVLAAVAENAYLRLFAVLVVVAAGAALLAVGIAVVIDLVVPLFFGEQLAALAALFPRIGG
ncbi:MULTISPECIES: hypothetical protein [unclassified Leifsonia]|uniref:hypothetical protein n=1 Tax=unclassified Leifsonia TaxID=2663824 RepID=UPI0025B8ECDD|nr:hypothetical protein [Leifsonia sp. 71-9]